MGERFLFALRWLRSPRHLGSITPSSRFLAQTLLGLAGEPFPSFAVELGPGTGPLTRGILDRLNPDGRLLAIERDPQLAAHLRRRFPDHRLTVVTGDAQDLQRHLYAAGFPRQIPLIVSGLPFSSLPPGVGEEILNEVTRALLPDGRLLLYQYSTFRVGMLQRHFGRVQTTWEIRNIPPAVCMRCMEPIRQPKD